MEDRNEVIEVARELSNPTNGFSSREEIEASIEVLASLIEEVESKGLLSEDELNYIKDLALMLNDALVNWINADNLGNKKSSDSEDDEEYHEYSYDM